MTQPDSIAEAAAENPFDPEPPPRYWPRDIPLAKGEHGFVIHGDPAPIFIALAKAKLEFKAIERTNLVKVRSEKGSYDFWYAPLEAVIGAVDEALGKHGLSQFQPLAKEGNAWVLRTILAHSSGSYIECTAELPQAPDWQKLGGAITYCRRYMLGSLLGVATDEDDDGTTAEGMHRETETRGAPARQNAQATPPKPKPASKPEAKQEAAPKPDILDMKVTEREPVMVTDPRFAETLAPETKSGPASQANIAKLGNEVRSRLYVTADGETQPFTQELVNVFASLKIGKPALVSGPNGGKQFNTNMTEAEAEKLLAAIRELPALNA